MTSIETIQNILRTRADTAISGMISSLIQNTRADTEGGGGGWLQGFGPPLTNLDYQNAQGRQL